MPQELKAAVLAASIKLCEEAMAATQVAKANLTAAMDARNKAFKAMNECGKRVRSGVKGVFGDDSLEFERMGGKRSSERKRPAKKAKPAAA